MSKISLSTLLIAFLVVAILLTYAFTYQVAFNEMAVKVRLGKADAGSAIREPGLKWRWPLIESIKTYDTRLRTLDTPETEIKTADGKNIIVGAYALWKIEDPLQFYRRVRTVEEGEKHMRSRLSQVQAAVIGQALLSDFVNLDVEKKDATYDRMLLQMRDGVAAGLMTDYGIGILQIGIRRISLPKETTEVVFRSMQQERNTQAGRLRQEGRSRAEGIRARAQSSADTILAFVRTRAQEIRSAGIAASTRILEMIPEEDREFFLMLREFDALRATFSQKTTIILDQESPLFRPFVNPPTLDNRE